MEPKERQRYPENDTLYVHCHINVTPTISKIMMATMNLERNYDVLLRDSSHSPGLFLLNKNAEHSFIELLQYCHVLLAIFFLSNLRLNLALFGKHSNLRKWLLLLASFT